MSNLTIWHLHLAQITTLCRCPVSQSCQPGSPLIFLFSFPHSTMHTSLSLSLSLLCVLFFISACEYCLSVGKQSHSSKLSGHAAFFPLRARWPRWLSRLRSRERATIHQQQTERSTAGHGHSFYSKTQPARQLVSFMTPPCVWEDTDEHCCHLRMFWYFPKRWFFFFFFALWQRDTHQTSLGSV